MAIDSVHLIAREKEKKNKQKNVKEKPLGRREKKNSEIIFVDREMFNINFYEPHKCNSRESDILSST